MEYRYRAHKLLGKLCQKLTRFTKIATYRSNNVYISRSKSEWTRWFFRFLLRSRAVSTAARTWLNSGIGVWQIEWAAETREFFFLQLVSRLIRNLLTTFIARGYGGYSVESQREVYDVNENFVLLLLIAWPMCTKMRLKVRTECNFYWFREKK